MFEKPISRESDKAICTIYKTYLERRKSGDTKRHARFFNEQAFHDECFNEWMNSDLIESLKELSSTGFVKTYMRYDFSLEDDAIVYMENRFKNGLSEVVDFISKLKP